MSAIYLNRWIKKFHIKSRATHFGNYLKIKFNHINLKILEMTQ